MLFSPFISSYIYRFPSEPPPQGSHGSTSPQLLISRFAHQLKQESPPSSLAMPSQQIVSSKESAKKRFASYVRLRLGSDRAPSPEPPPRLSRGESPLALRRNLIEQASPSFPRRCASPLFVCLLLAKKITSYKIMNYNWSLSHFFNKIKRE